MNKILITGGTGFIGKVLVDKLSNINSSIRLLSRKSSTVYETVCCDFEHEEVPYFSCDSIDTVFHLAGYAHDLSNSTNNEYLYHLINVNATVDLAKIAAENGVKNFIFVSSVKAGGYCLLKESMDENDQTEPENIYGKTKREAEIKLLEIGKKSGMHTTIIRPALVYGPGVKGNLQQMQAGIKNGWFPPLPKVNNRRSMIHVEDLVEALIMVASDSRANGQIYIATDGITYSSRQIYEANCALVGKNIPNWSVPRFLFNAISKFNKNLSYKIDKLLCNEHYSSKKLQSIGFKPKHSLFDLK